MFFLKEKLEKFSSRKYKIVVFWNSMSFIALALQALLSYLGKLTVIPTEIIIGITGTLNAGYMGVNLLQKKPFTSKKEEE